MSKRSSEILVIGGGAAGLSSALAASEYANVTIADDNPKLGGQIWRAELGRIGSPEANRLIGRITAGNVKIINNAQIYGAETPESLVAATPEGRLELQYQKLIIATGARECFLPFRGWTLPGVFGAGGLQAMVKGGMPIARKRVVVAGTGPLLLAVADYLKAKGAKVVAIAEQASRASINRFAMGLWRYPAKVRQAALLRIRLRGVEYLTGSWVTAASGDGKVQKVTLSDRGRPRSIDCDYLACGFHLVPNTELASVLGCTISNGCVEVDEFQRTSIDNVYCAGEPTGIGGVEASLIEGQIAGLSATGQSAAARALFKTRNKARRFGNDLNDAFALRPELKTLAADDTIVCRCEDVEYQRLTKFTCFRDAKLQTRCGMGPCQGRICGSAAEFLFGWEPPSVRPPIFPVKMEDL